MNTFKCSREEQLAHQVSVHSQKINTTNEKHNKHSRLRRITALRDIMPDAKSVLCVGARSDSEVQDFLDSGYEKCIGIDVNKEQLLIKNIDAHELDQFFTENEFDIVYMSHSLEHMHDAKLVMRHVSKICKNLVLVALPHAKKALTPGLEHPSIFDIMKNCPSDLQDLKNKLYLLDDFQDFGKFILRNFYKNTEYADFEMILELIK